MYIINGIVMMDNNVEIATHFDASTESLSNISENIEVLVAAGIAMDIITQIPGNFGTPANKIIPRASKGMKIRRIEAAK